MKKVILYDKPECPFCWKVRIALHESEIEVELIDSNIPEQRQIWESLTPRKTVPVLLDGGLVIYESNVILEYLSEVKGRLLPPDPPHRIVPRLINSYSDSVIGGGLREIIFEKREKDERSWDRKRIQAGTDAFEQALNYLSQMLGEREFFGNSYSIAECALTARFGLAEAYGVAIPDRFPNLQRWYSTMKLRPSFAATAPRKDAGWGALRVGERSDEDTTAR